MRRVRPALWSCPACGERFTTPNQWHSCGTFSLDDLFAGCEPEVRRLFERFRAVVEQLGPVRVIPQRSRIAFQARMRFAAVMPQKRALKGHLVLARRRESPCFEKVETLSRRNHLHVFRLTAEGQMGDDFRRFLREAYAVGRQQHLED